MNNKERHILHTMAIMYGVLSIFLLIIFMMTLSSFNHSISAITFFLSMHFSAISLLCLRQRRVFLGNKQIKEGYSEELVSDTEWNEI